MTIATGLATGHAPQPELAKQAVQDALKKAGVEFAHSVLLFLTPEFANDPQPALLAASRAANCTAINGCSAAGIFTEQGWVQDRPAAAAMVFGGDTRLMPAHDLAPEALALSLSTPGAATPAWFAEHSQRLGGIAGDATGPGRFKVWCGGRVSHHGHCELAIQGARATTGVSLGVLPLGSPLEITQASGYDVLTLDQQPALHILAHNLPPAMREQERIPLHLIMVGTTFGDPSTAIGAGRFQLSPIISANMDDHSVTLSVRLEAGTNMFWALRQPQAAEQEMIRTLDQLQQEVAAPDFGLMFSCIGRGPAFYGGEDRDLELVRQRFPGMPLIGFYGNGEIAPLHGASQLLQYSTALGLFSVDV